MNNLFDNPPHPEDSPILVLFDIDNGWLVESVEDGEFEAQNLPFPGYFNEEPDLELAIKLAKERNVRVKYYFEWPQRIKEKRKNYSKIN